MNSNAFSTATITTDVSSLSVVQHGAQHGTNDKLPLVLLHGWGGDSSTFTELVSRLSLQRAVITVDLPGCGQSPQWSDFRDDALSLDRLFAAMAEQLPDHFDLLGWSLGGMLAVRFAHQYSNRVKHVVTVASNALFVASEDWPAAMAEQIYKEFCRYFAESPQTCLKQFCGLQAQGDQQQRQLLKHLRRLLPEATNHNWLTLLKLLGRLDNRDILRELATPVLHILGAQDQLVPCSAATLLSQLNSNHQVEILANIAHPVHLAAGEQLCSNVEQFLGKEGYLLAKHKVAESFSKAAATYDGVAYLQRKVGDKLLARLPDSAQLCGGIQRVLDVGCGTGYLFSHLEKTLPDSDLLGLDIASGMLRFSRERQLATNASTRKQWLCGDAELLPLENNRVDLLVSNLAYQWCQHPMLWGTELSRVLAPDGLAMISTLGPQTLYELRTAWSEVDGYVHVNEFMPLEKLMTLLDKCGLHSDVIIETEVLTYSNINDLMRELKELGAHNINAGQSSALTGRQRLRKLNQAYEQFRSDDGLLTATYEVAYLMIRHNY